MTEIAAHLVDEVIPEVPVRQWVLTFPHDIRYLLAWNSPLRAAVLSVPAFAVTLSHGSLAALDTGAPHACAGSPLPQAGAGAGRARP